MKRILILLTVMLLSVTSIFADTPIKVIGTTWKNSNAIKIGTFSDGITHYMTGRTAHFYLVGGKDNGRDIGEIAIGYDKRNRIWVVNRTDRRVSVPVVYWYWQKRADGSGSYMRKSQRIILDPGEYECPELDLSDSQEFKPQSGNQFGIELDSTNWNFYALD